MLSTSAWARGIRARSQALITEGPGAERHYIAAIELLGKSRMVVHHARAHLIYGEWLRRQRRRVDARTSLRMAENMFKSMGAEAFAARADRELLATGERTQKRTGQSTHNSQLRNARSPASHTRADPTLKSPASCSSVRAPSSTTSERSSASSVSPPATS